MTARDVIAQALALSEAASKGPWHEEAGNVHGPNGGRLATLGGTYDAAVPNAGFTAAARTLLPAFAKALGDVLDLHSEIEMFEADPTNGTWLYDENGEKRPLPSICRHCTPDDTLLEVEECNWDDGMETVRYPCPTRAAITAALSEVAP